MRFHFDDSARSDLLRLKLVIAGICQFIRCVGFVGH